MFQVSQNKSIVSRMSTRPAAMAKVKGDVAHPKLRAVVSFYPYRDGTLVLTEAWGLPFDPAPCAANVFAIHMHTGSDCSADMHMPFSSAGGHYNPQNCPHPAHAGDMPPLFGSKGYAWQSFYTDRFTPDEIVGKTVIIHSQRDDFTTQPAGDSGTRIGCGLITR